MVVYRLLPADEAPGRHAVCTRGLSEEIVLIFPVFLRHELNGLVDRGGTEENVYLRDHRTVEAHVGEDGDVLVVFGFGVGLDEMLS